MTFAQPGNAPPTAWLLVACVGIPAQQPDLLPSDLVVVQVHLLKSCSCTCITATRFTQSTYAHKSCMVKVCILSAVPHISNQWGRDSRNMAACHITKQRLEDVQLRA